MISPIYPFTVTVTSSYVSGGVYLGIKEIGTGSFELANLGKPTVLLALDPTIIPSLTSTLSASYGSYLYP